MITLVVDVEATCWPDDQPDLRNRQREISEIIEIGAVRLVGPELRVDGEYQAFVRPVAHPELSTFCRELTSIDQADVEAAAPFPQAWASFLDWFAQDLPDVVMASWSAYDHVLFARQCAEHELSAPPWTHLDVKDEYGQFTFVHEGRRGRASLAHALDRLQVPVEGRAHRAIVDARNTAALLQRLRSPDRLSLLARHVLREVAVAPQAKANAGRLRGAVPSPGRWYYRVRQELVRVGVCVELPSGRGLHLTPLGEQVVERLDLADLPAAVEPRPPGKGDQAGARPSGADAPPAPERPD